MTFRSLPSRAVSMLLAGTAILALPAVALAAGSGGSPSAPPPSRESDATHLVIAQNDVVMDESQDDEQDPAMTAGTDDRGTWRQARGGRDRGDEDSRDEDQGGNRSWNEGRSWHDGRSGGSGMDGNRWRRSDNADEGSHGDGWGGRGGWSPDRERMLAMHGRMMRMMQGARAPAAGFRIEMGTTRMAVRCSPRETMQDCVDAALSLVNRLRDATSGARPMGQKEGSGSSQSGSSSNSGGPSGTASGPGSSSSGNSSAQ